jgi:hypothetical protein
MSRSTQKWNAENAAVGELTVLLLGGDVQGFLGLFTVA